MKKDTIQTHSREKRHRNQQSPTATIRGERTSRCAHTATSQPRSLSFHRAILSDALKAAQRLQLLNSSKFSYGVSSSQERGRKFNWQVRNISLGLTQDSIWATSDLPTYYKRSSGELKCLPKTSRCFFPTWCLSFLHHGQNFTNTKHAASMARASFSLYI